MAPAGITRSEIGFIHANGQDYRIVDERAFVQQAQELIQSVDALRADGKIQRFQNVEIQIIAGTEQRRQELMALIPKVDPQKKIYVKSELFPFDFHSYKWRGRTSMFIVIDDEIAEQFYAGFDHRAANNQQLMLNHTLTTICHVADKAYSELYFIVKKGTL